MDFALVMDVLPNDREKAKDLAVWHQVECYKAKPNKLGSLKFFN